MDKSIIFIYSLIFLILWVFINNFGYVLFTKIVLLILAVLFLLYYIFYKRFLVLLIISFLSIVIWILISAYNFDIINKKESTLNSYFDNKNYKILFQVIWVNKIEEFKTEYNAKLIQVWEKEIKDNINFIFKIANNYNLEKWLVLQANTKLYEFKDFSTFSYKNYMLSKNLYFSTNIYSFEKISLKKPTQIEEYIIDLRKEVLKIIYEIYPKQEAIFLWWILMWARESLPEDLKQNFNNSGLTHFIAVSWFNITILIIFLTYILKYFPVFIRVIFITIFITFFTILVWDTAPVIRASIMWLIWYYVILSGRSWNILAIILLTAFIMVLLSPLSLNYDVSLHLSFLAVLWIIYSQKFFERVFYFLPNILEVRTAFTLTLSALVFTLPIMVFNFWQVSILAPFSNISVTWTIPLAMLLWFISIIVYYVFPFLWILVWYITWIFLKWDIMMVYFFWWINWSVLKIDIGIYKNHIEIIYFITLIFLIIWFRKKEQN